MNARFNFSQKGQILVMFAIGLIGLLALGALVIDGGQTFVHRRQAQAAADAGAMAGAQLICAGEKNVATVQNKVLEYTTTRNLADATALSDIAVNIANKNVTVTAKINQTSFLAHLLGFNNASIPATASAGCFSPSEARVMPIAFSCKNSIGTPSNEATNCALASLDWKTQMKPLLYGCAGYDNPSDCTGSVVVEGVTDPVSIPFDFEKKYLPQIYIFMDSDKGNLDHCASPLDPTNGFDCDINNDGVLDFRVGGGRSWLDLNGAGGGESEIRGWLRDGVSFPIKVHSWIPQESGVSAGFKDVDCYILGNKNGSGDGNNEKGKCKINNPVLLPIINYACNANDPTTESDCQYGAHLLSGSGIPLAPGEVDVYTVGNGSKPLYFHIVGFGTMYVTCVDDGAGKAACPGHNAALGKKDNTKTIEGYFIRNYPINLSGVIPGGADFGVNFASLTQ